MSTLTESLQQARAELAEARQRIAELETRLRAAETETRTENYHLLSESIPDGLIIFTANETVDQNRIVEVNESACQLLGYTRAELLNQTLADLDNPESFVLPPDLSSRLFQGEHIVTEQTHRRKDGRLVPLEVHARLGMLRGQPVIVSLTHDISRRKAMETDLHRFEAAIRQTDDAVIITDAPQGQRPRVLFANQAFTRITGYTLHEAQEKDITILQRPGTFVADDPDLRVMHQAAFTHGVYQGKTHSFHKSGHPITLHWSISPITDQAGVTTNFVAVVRDITPQEQQMQQMQAMTQDIQIHRDHLNAILNSMQDALLSISLQDRRVVHVSASFEEIFGYPAERFVSDPNFFTQVVHPDDLTAAIEMRQRALSEGIADLDHRIVLPNGNIRWLHRRAWMNYDADGRPIRVNDSARDITRQKLAEAELQAMNVRLEQRVAERTAELEATKDRIEAIFDHSADAILLLHIEDGLQQTNRAFDRLFNAPVGGCIGHKLSACFSPSDAAEIERIVAEVSASKQTRQIEAKARRVDGPLFDVEISLAPVNPAEDRVENLVCIIRDVTERKQAQEAIRESEERYRTLITLMSEGIVLQGQNGAIHTCNEAAAQILGLSMDQLVGRTSIDPRWRAVYQDGSPFDGETHPAMVTLRTGEACSNVIMGVHKPDGSLTWISINSRPVFKPGQPQPEAVVVTFADVSQRMETEQALQRALVHEKELGELKSRFVTMTSHEFRTPLAAILATTETLAIYRQRMDGAQIDERLERIRRQVLHMKGLMEDVQQMARMQAGRVQFKPEIDALDALCLELIEEAETQDHHRGRISFACSQQPLPAFFDSQLMRQVIGNVLSNALKYSPAQKPVQVSLAQVDGQIHLMVQDQGIGIPAEDQPHLFAPFHRAQNVGAVSGTGLGLSIAKQALDLHQGTIHVESHVDVGTTISISLPNPLAEDSFSDKNTGD